jgi:hypothetical protein
MGEVVVFVAPNGSLLTELGDVDIAVEHTFPLVQLDASPVPTPSTAVIPAAIVIMRFIGLSSLLSVE